MRGLSGKRALVTGGSKGIGLASARRLLEEGGTVVICGRDRDALAEAQKELAPLRVHAVACDVSSSAEVDQTVIETVRLLGGIDILVNNAGIFIPGRPSTSMTRPGEK
jgi:NAD(P)-dependent dehydrogenase (short-subunit alcohol dehydrogenase family)